MASEVKFDKEPTHTRRWVSLSIVFLVTFLLAIQNSIYWNSLFPFLRQMDSSASETFFGICITAFNLGGAMASPLFGLWTNKIQQCKIPIIAGIMMTVLGNLLLIFVESFTSNRKWVILVARFISGIGFGNYGSLYAYVVMGSTYEERNKALAFRGAINSAAIMTGPAIGAAFVPLGYPGHVWGEFRVSTYTAPGIANILFGIIQIGVIIAVFKEYWVGVAEIEKSTSINDDGDECGTKRTLKPYDKTAAGVCIWTRFAQMFCLAFDLTLGAPLTMAMFGWNASEAVLYNGIILTVASALDFAGNLIMGNIVLRYVQERKVIILGISVFILFFVVAFQYPGLPPLLSPLSENSTFLSVPYNDSLLNHNGSGLPVINSNASIAADGCFYRWCSYTTRIYLAQYILAFMCLMLSLTFVFTPNATLFSKIVGPRKQGTLQGIFAGSGQLAMTIAPLAVSTTFEYAGPRVTNVIGASVLTFTVVLNVVFYKRLLPWTDETEHLILKKKDNMGTVLKSYDNPVSLKTEPTE